MKVKDFIERLSKLPPNKEVVDMYWCAEDVEQQAADNGVELTEEQVSEVISLLSSEHDANIGINWDTISYWIDYVKE